MIGTRRSSVPVFALLAMLFGHGFAFAQFAWNPPTNKIVVLAVNSHPDDEGIFFGGTLPYYSAALGLPTMLLSMTSGDWYPTNLPIREAELKCAAWTYGLRYEPLFGRFRDVPSQNMANNPYPNKIDATWDYWADGILQGDGSDVEAGKIKAINFIAEQIRRYRPEIIITHDINGEYGHHNHIATSYAVTNAFFVAADPSASAPNLVGLPPWQAKKLYLHLYATNRLFHRFLEISLSELSDRSSREAADEGLNCHVSQKSPDVSTVFRTGENYDPYPSEWWGLYASTVGPDTVLADALDVGGYTVPAGASAGNFLEHLGIIQPPAPPAFASNPLVLPIALAGRDYSSVNSVLTATDPNLAWGDTLTFEKLSGPSWLSVNSQGVLGGVPNRGDIGTNVFTVQVTDSGGSQDQTTALVLVRDPFPEVLNLVGWWRLDEQSGNYCADSALPAQNGAIIGPTQLGQGGATPATGFAALFNGKDSKIDVPYAAELNPPAFTASLWVKVLGAAGTYRSPLTSRESLPAAGYVFYAGQNNLWQFWLGTGTTWKTLSAGAVSTNSWMHLAGTYDGTKAKFYTNGVLAASSDTTFRLNETFPLRIGAGASESSGQYWFPGYVDDVRIYQTALTEEQIGAIYSNQPPRFLSSPASVSVLAGNSFVASLSGSATDPGDFLTYGKLSGPAWLRVEPEGAMSGMPFSADVGPNNFTVAVADSLGVMDTTSFDVYVLPGLAPAFLKIERTMPAGIRLGLTGAPGQTYVIEASPVPATGAWQPVGTNVSGAAWFEWSDPEAGEEGQRFYRAVVP